MSSLLASTASESASSVSAHEAKIASLASVFTEHCGNTCRDLNSSDQLYLQAILDSNSRDIETRVRKWKRSVGKSLNDLIAELLLINNALHLNLISEEQDDREEVEVDKSNTKETTGSTRMAQKRMLSFSTKLVDYTLNVTKEQLHLLVIYL